MRLQRTQFSKRIIFVLRLNEIFHLLQVLNVVIALISSISSAIS